MNGFNTKAYSTGADIIDPPDSGNYLLLGKDGDTEWISLPSGKAILIIDNGTISSIPYGTATQLLNGSGGWTDTEACT